jgi:hypothetical protein
MAHFYHIRATEDFGGHRSMLATFSGSLLE